MFISALFTRARTWKQPKCPSTDEWIKKMWFVCVYIYRRRQRQPTPVFLPGKSHGWRSLVGCGPWCRWGLDTTERLHFHFSLFTFMHWRRKWQPTPVFLPGESQGREAWWAAVYGVAQSQTWLKRLSSSSSSISLYVCMYVNVCVCIYTYTHTTSSLSIHLSMDI